MPKAHAKAVRGPIPVNITYVLRAPSTVKRGWDQGDDDPDLPVVDTFPVDADSPGSLATARAWASHYYGRSNGAPAEPVEFTVPNAPMTGVTLVSLEHRGQGGRAWKVTVEPHPDHPPLRVDFREGPLLETLLTTGCAAGEIAGSSSGAGSARRSSSSGSAPRCTGASRRNTPSRCDPCCPPVITLPGTPT